MVPTSRGALWRAMDNRAGPNRPTVYMTEQDVGILGLMTTRFGMLGAIIVTMWRCPQSGESTHRWVFHAQWVLWESQESLVGSVFRRIDCERVPGVVPFDLDNNDCTPSLVAQSGVPCLGCGSRHVNLLLQFCVQSVQIQLSSVLSRQR